MLINHDLLTTQPAAGLLFPVAAWASVRTWRAMGRSRYLAVRAGADIALSLLLGTDLVLLLAWGANLLDLREGEVAALRGTLEHAGAVVDLPWWLRAGLYLLLAAASLALVLWPARLAALTRWWQRLRAVSSIDLTRRALTVVHIGLAVTVLIGLTAPAALDGTLTAQLKARYTLALQRELTAAGELAAYQEIRQQFTPGSGTVPSLRSLAGIVDRVHDVSSPAAGSSDATSTERDLAATAVAGLIQIPGLGDNEVVQIIKEYLSGLVESGTLKKVFTAWAKRVAGVASPRADQMVVPDPRQLEDVALIVLVQERLKIELANPLAPDRASQRTLRESPGDAAVDLVNETRYFEEGSGPCDGCPRPLLPGQRPGEVPGEHPDESHEDPIP